MSKTKEEKQNGSIKKSSLFNTQGVPLQKDQDLEDVKSCLAEVEPILKKWGCQVSVTKKVMFNQTVFVPVFEKKPPER